MELLKGINLGGWLSQCIHTNEHYETFITKEDIRTIAEAGFDHVRVPVDYNVWETESGWAKGSGYLLTDALISWCEEFGLNAILDLHKACGYDFGNAHNPEKNNLFASEDLQNRFINLWQRTAIRYGSKENVAFELLNEVVEEENTEVWNRLIERTVKAIRLYAPSSTIIYGGIQWNNVEKLRFLDKPIDENIIYTFHFYSPMPFTHQKAEWVHYLDHSLTTHYPNDDLQWNMEYTRQMILSGIEVSKERNVRLYCGEFGVINHAPVEDTLRWYKDTVKVFSEYGIGYAPWTYKSMSFGLWDEHYSPIRKEILSILTDQ